MDMNACKEAKRNNGIQKAMNGMKRHERIIGYVCMHVHDDDDDDVVCGSVCWLKVMCNVCLSGLSGLSVCYD